MKKVRIPVLVVASLLALMASVSSCSKKDTDDIVIIQPLAGDYTGTEDAGSKSLSQKTLFSPVYVTRIHNANLGNDSQVFVENIANINATDTLVSAASLSPKERFLVTLNDGKFTIPATTRSIQYYETPGRATSASTLSTTFNNFYNALTPNSSNASFDLRTKYVYTIKADGAITGDILTLKYEVTGGEYTRYVLMRKKRTRLIQPKDSVALDSTSSGSGDNFSFGNKAFPKKATFIGNREFKAPIVQGG